MMRSTTLPAFLAGALVAAFLVFAAAAGEEGPGAGTWESFAGAEEEREAEGLELRDELIASQLEFLAALEAALAEIAATPADDPRLPLAWARVEYLLETSYRLVADSGEHAEFLKVTESLKPAEAPPPEPAALGNSGEPGSLAESLSYRDASGRPLRAEVRGGRAVLVDAETGEPVASPEQAIAHGPTGGDDDASAALIRARAAWLRAKVLENLGRVREASAETAGLGLIRDWLLLGPLDGDNDDSDAIAYDLAGAYETMEDRPYNGKNGPVSWRAVSSQGALGRLHPGAYVHAPGLNGVVALALVHSPREGGAVLRFGSNAPVTVCVNHTQGRRRRSSGLSDPDQDAFDVWLRRGWNVVLVRSASDSEYWALTVRLTAPDGSPFPGYVLKTTEAPVAETLAQARETARLSAPERLYRPETPAGRGGITVLSDWLDEHPADARANFYLASLLAAKRMMEGGDRFDRELIFRRATELSGGNPFYTLTAARSVDYGVDGPDREENLRLVLLRQVADRGSAAALVDIGRLYLDVMRQPRRAREYAGQALEMNPLSLRAGVLNYDVAEAMGWRPVAGDLLRRLVKRHPNAAAARLRLGRASLAGGRPRQALGEFHAVLGVDSMNREAFDGVVRALGMLGQTSAALELLVGHIDRFPYDFAVRLKLAELYRVLGRDDDARTVVEAALAMAPDDPRALAMRQELERESYAEGGAGEGEAAEKRMIRQELDLSRPAVPPPDGWEYLYFQVEDRMDGGGAIERTVAFAVRVHSERAARMLRHLGFWLEKDFESGVVTSLEIVQPSGGREALIPSTVPVAGGQALRFNLPPLREGQIIEAEVSIRRQRAAFLGDYFGQIAPLSQQAPVRLSRYMFTSPREQRLFFKAVNGAPEAMIVSSPDGREVTRIWEMNDLPAFIAEPDSPGRGELMPCVQVSSFGDWDEFARWYRRLIAPQYHAPPEFRQLAGKIAGRERIPLVRLDRAAEWVAGNIAHRDWEYGPYAFRPVNARAVLSRLSADGKDRTLFLCLLAREYGLEAWPVLARLRDRRFAPVGADDMSLPLLDYFNHSLVMVESAGGDVFLDASNPHRSPGVMPSQLFGSPGVAILAGGAERVLVPDGGADACLWIEEADMVVDDDGSILWEEKIKGEGTAAEALRARFRDEEGRAAAWTSFLAMLGGDVSTSWCDFRDVPLEPAAASFSGRARLRRWASAEDDRVFLNVPALPGSVTADGGFSYPLSLDDFARYGLREQDLVLPHGFKVVRTLRVSYPDNWRLVNPPSPRSVSFSFGSVSLACEESSGHLFVEFTVDLPGHRVAAAEYADFRRLAALVERWLRPVLVWEKP